MPSLREVLVTTTSSFEGMPVKKYIRPVSAHVVTGMNIFNDILGSFSDFFGGRSSTYQRQIKSIYNEAVERIKYAAYELGGNAVLGLSIDVDEISGGGKSMLMITATGTAVVVDRTPISKDKPDVKTNGDLVTADALKIHRQKVAMLAKARENTLPLDQNTWDFITSNAAPEFYGYLMMKCPEVLAQASVNPQVATDFFRALGGYLDALPEETRKELLYGSLAKENKPFVIQQISDLIKQGNLFDENYIYRLLKHGDFGINKRGLMSVTADKAYYNEQDVTILESLRNYIAEHFPERGERTTKQGFLSSKQKPAWKCGCGKTNEIDNYCGGCQHDIFGFTQTELPPPSAIAYLNEKIEAIKMHLQPVN